MRPRAPPAVAPEQAEACAMVAQLCARGLPVVGFDTYGMGSHVALRLVRLDGRLRAITFTVLDQLADVEALVRREIANTWPLCGPMYHARVTGVRPGPAGLP